MHLRFVNPNFHVILVHYPLGVFVLGVFLELFSFLWRRSSVRVAAKWMIVIGALMTLPAATSGIFALTDVKHQGITDVRYFMLRQHVLYMGAASILAVFCAVVGLGASDRVRRALYFPLLLGVVAAWGLMVVGAWHGGETIYQQGTSVAIIKVKTVEGDDGTSQKKTVLVPLDEGEHNIKTAIKTRDYKEITDYWVGGDLQQHLIMAGFAFAAALGALGLSIRRLHATSIGAMPEVVLQRDVPAPRGGAPRRVTDDISVIRSFNPETEYGATAGKIPSGRFWLLASLVIIATSALGYWTLTGQEIFKPEGWTSFLGILKPDDPAVKVNRYMAHTVLGGAFLVLSLICALLAGVAPKRPLLLTFFSSLLIAVIAAQVWVGVLLTFQHGSPDGSLLHFQTDEENRQQQERLETKHSSNPATTAPTTANTPDVPSVAAHALPDTVPSAPAIPASAPAIPVPAIPAPAVPVPPAPTPTPEPPVTKPAPEIPAVPPVVIPPAPAVPAPKEIPAPPPAPSQDPAK